jgi:hypothetical protein
MNRPIIPTHKEFDNFFKVDGSPRELWGFAGIRMKEEYYDRGMGTGMRTL